MPLQMLSVGNFKLTFFWKDCPYTWHNIIILLIIDFVLVLQDTYILSYWTWIKMDRKQIINYKSKWKYMFFLYNFIKQWPIKLQYKETNGLCMQSNLIPRMFFWKYLNEPVDWWIAPDFLFINMDKKVIHI